MNRIKIDLKTQIHSYIVSFVLVCKIKKKIYNNNNINYFKKKCTKIIQEFKKSTKY